jgi:hypothetical protein
MVEKESSIVFNGPSPQSKALLNYDLKYRQGATPWNFPNVDLGALTTQKGQEYTIGQATFPEEHPLSEMKIIFHPYEYENSPFSGCKEYRHITGYDLTITTSLKQPHVFDENEARHILTLLQENTGFGEYRQLANGKHQIVIPDTVSRPIMGLLADYHTKDNIAAILELGYDNPDRGIEYIKKLKKETPLLQSWEINYLDERRKELEKYKNQPTLDSLRIRLKSGEVFDEWIDMGDNNQFEGRTKDLGLQDQILDFFFVQTAPFLFEAVCKYLSPEVARGFVMVRIQHPDVALFADTDPNDITGKPPKDWRDLIL